MLASMMSNMSGYIQTFIDLWSYIFDIVLFFLCLILPNLFVHNAFCEFDKMKNKLYLGFLLGLGQQNLNVCLVFVFPLCEIWSTSLYDFGVLVCMNPFVRVKLGYDNPILSGSAQQVYSGGVVVVRVES